MFHVSCEDLVDKWPSTRVPMLKVSLSMNIIGWGPKGINIRSSAQVLRSRGHHDYIFSKLEFLSWL